MLFRSGLYGGGTYNWKNLDTYLTAITSAGMRPIIETDFMPTALGSSSSDAMHSPPKDYNAWKSYITALVQHCVDKYGKDDVGTWYFEIWNEPNYPGFWVNSDMKPHDGTNCLSGFHFTVVDAGQREIGDREKPERGEEREEPHRGG